MTACGRRRGDRASGAGRGWPAHGVGTGGGEYAVCGRRGGVRLRRGASPPFSLLAKKRLRPQALRYALPGGRGSGSGGRSRPSQVCTPMHGNGASRATCLQVSAKLEPRPTLTLASTAEVSCQNPRTCPNPPERAGFGHKSVFLLDRARPVFFGKTKENGGAIPVPWFRGPDTPPGRRSSPP